MKNKAYLLRRYVERHRSKIHLTVGVYTWYDEEDTWPPSTAGN